MTSHKTVYGDEMNEPKSELARYAFGYSDKKPSWLFWAIQATMLAFVLWAIFSPAFACHRYSVWSYPWPQPRCAVRVAQVETPIISPNPPPRPIYLEVPGNVDIDIPLPSLDNMEFPPDCLIDWCERLKGIGLLRDKFESN